MNRSRREAAPMTRCIALLRGINVGRANRIAMAQLRGMIEALGYGNVRTLLNSGNVLFDASRPRVNALARSIEAGIASTFGISARVVVVRASDVAGVVRENPLRAVASDPARSIVAFATSAATLARAAPLARQTWAPEAFALGQRAAYLWCANGVADSKLAEAFARVTGDAVTSRNWSTVLKLHVAASADAKQL